VSLTLPAFVQFQAPLFPLRGLWDTRPNEGDKFINAEIDWGTPGLSGVSCVQFQLSGNSPVAFSQIVAMSVDNSRCGSDVDFIFPDSGFILSVPGYNQGVYPVFSNALMFYANAPLAVAGDVTIVQILNSMPPPVAIQPSEAQSHAAAPNIDLHTNAATALVPPPISGTIQAFTLAISGAAATAGSAFFQLIDGTGAVLYSQQITIPTGNYSQTVPVTGIRLRFINGLSAVISGSTVPASSANIVVNLYYAVP
jgi:hypothetical protein